MARSGSKEQAERILQELPSVLAAYVREDIGGNPREVHLLVAPGPDVRELARDIRNLLEERMGVAIDQRIISIAQLSESAAELALPLNEPVGDEAAPEPDDLSPTESSESVTAIRPGTRGPPPLAEPRLVYEGFECWTRDGEAAVRVRTSWRGSTFEGEARDVDSTAGRIRAAATATLAAATAACRSSMTFNLEGASLARVVDHDVVLVSAFASSPVLGRRPVHVVGAHPLDSDHEEAAVLASLKAIARVAALGLLAGDES